eukprot:5287795-Alexandrium_andersonii.AAC.1
MLEAAVANVKTLGLTRAITDPKASSASSGSSQPAKAPAAPAPPLQPANAPTTPPEALLAVVGTGAAAIENAKVKANSVTHKAAYDRFIRRCASKRKFPSSLTKDYEEDKNELFNTWLEVGEDFAK